MKRFFLRWTALFLAGILLVPAHALAAEPEFAGGSGTYSSPYQIATAQQLNNVRNYLDKYFVLTDDIVFTEADFAEGGDFYNGGGGWTAIGTEKAPFSGTLDGNGYTITGLYQKPELSNPYYGGLFGYLSKATIDDLDLLDVEICLETSVGMTYAGAVAGYAGNQSHISNCYVTGSIGSDERAGGIVGVLAGTSTITNCRNDAHVFISRTSGNAGGIAGRTYTNTQITNCWNTGRISDVYYESLKSDVGGIAGYLSGKVTDCWNSGEIDSFGTAGGIAGNAIGGSSTKASITQCYNIGTVSGSGATGGIVGSGQYLTVTKCYNAGAVTYTGISTGTGAGGILGSMFDTASAANCFNAGPVTSGSYAGGIVGYAYNLTSAEDAKIQTCYNAGTVSGRSDLYRSTGAIAGWEVYFDFENCYYLDNCDCGVGKSYKDEVATKLSDEEMRSSSKFSGFNFSTVWTVSGNADYPYPELKNVDMKPDQAWITETEEGVVIQLSPLSAFGKEGVRVVVSLRDDSDCQQEVTLYSGTELEAMFEAGGKTISVESGNVGCVMIVDKDFRPLIPAFQLENKSE